MTIPHCPNPDCGNFSQPKSKKWCASAGIYHRNGGQTVQRYMCRLCGKTFSHRTFSIDYWTHSSINYKKLFDNLISSSGVNAAGRIMKISKEVVRNRCDRLARCCLAVTSELTRHLPMNEHLAAGGMESFTLSQYFPHHINLFVGCQSELIYQIGFANLRRRGRMTKKQKERRAQLEKLGKALPGAVRESMRILIEEMAFLFSEKRIAGFTLTTDEHKAYPRALKAANLHGVRVEHVQISSKKPRTIMNPLFPVNYAERQIRKDVCEHARETVKYGKCPCAMMLRLAVYVYYHNYVIARREHEARKGNNKTHAEEAGLNKRLINEVIRKHLFKRVFLSKLHLSLEERRTWLYQRRNPGVKMGHYIPKFIAV